MGREVCAEDFMMLLAAGFATIRAAHSVAIRATTFSTFEL